MELFRLSEPVLPELVLKALRWVSLEESTELLITTHITKKNDVLNLIEEEEDEFYNTMTMFGVEPTTEELAEVNNLRCSNLVKVAGVVSLAFGCTLDNWVVVEDESVLLNLPTQYNKGACFTIEESFLPKNEKFFKEFDKFTRGELTGEVFSLFSEKNKVAADMVKVIINYTISLGLTINTKDFIRISSKILLIDILKLLELVAKHK